MTVTRKARILIADDEYVISRCVSFMLKKEGYECRTVSDGEAALEALRADPPDLLILDLDMPKKNGNAGRDGSDLVAVDEDLAYRNSFQAWVNEKNATTASAGSDIGRMMRTRVPSREQPSTSAASSSSRGTERKYPIRSQVQNGTVKPRYARHQPVMGVDEPERRHHGEQRDEEERRRHQVREDQAPGDRPAPREFEPGERVGAQTAEHERGAACRPPR